MHDGRQQVGLGQRVGLQQGPRHVAGPIDGLALVPCPRPHLRHMALAPRWPLFHVFVERCGVPDPVSAQRRGWGSFLAPGQD